MPELPDVRPGQVWEDCDKRSKGRLILVLDVPEVCSKCEPWVAFESLVKVEVVRSRDVASGPEDARTRGRVRRIKRRRFRPVSTGYRLTDLTSEDVS